MPYEFLIIDDERLSRNYIHDLIAEFVPDAVISEKNSARVGLEVLQKGTTDILLLDVRMPEMDGFDLLNALPERNFELIFITAYSEYAIQAIKEGAVDYLLKPIRKTEFRDMLQKVMARRKTKQEKLSADEEDTYLTRKLAINHQQGRQMIALKDIVYLQAFNSYTTLFLGNGQKVVTSKPISKYEATLPVPWFFRIHKSYIINMAHLREYSSLQGGQVLMNNGVKLGISRYRLSDFLTLLKNTDHTLKL